MSKFLLLLFILFSSLCLFAQTQDEFNERLSDIYVAAANSSDELKELANSLYTTLEKNKELHTYANYFSLKLVFENQVPNEKLALACKERSDKLLNEMIGVTTPIQTDSKIKSPSQEWLSVYYPNLFKSRDIKFSFKAVKFLDKHPDLQNFNNYTFSAYSFERNGDFENAQKYYEYAMELANKDEYHSYSFYCNFLSKSGQYQKAEEIIEIIRKLSVTASDLYKVSYKTELVSVRSIYYLNIGDYLNYMEASIIMYDNFSKLNSGSNCNFLGSSKYTITAFVNETLHNYNVALEQWSKRDSLYLAETNCYNKTYPNNKQLMLSMLPVYLLKTGNQKDLKREKEALITEVETYYDNFKEYGNVNTRHMRALHLAFLNAPSYPEQFETVLKEIKDTRDFSESTLPFSNYAYFSMRDRNFVQAKKTYEDLFSINADWINDLIFTFGEKAFVTYYNIKLKVGYQNFHSYVKLSKELDQKDYSDIVSMAYDNILLTKSIGFKSSQKRKNAFLKSNNPEIVELYHHWVNLKKKLIQSYQKTQGAEPKEVGQLINKDSLVILQEEVHHLEDQLANKAENFHDFLELDQPSWKEVKNKLKKGEAAIEILRFKWRDQIYYSDTSYYAAYLIKYDSPHPEVIYLPATANDLDGRYYNLYRNSIRLKIEDNNSYEQYWQPIKEQLDGIDKVFFSPDGIYHLINLPTLKNPSSNNYLLDEIKIQYVTTTALSSNANTKKISSSVLVGRPTYDLEENITATSTNAVVTRSFVSSFREGNIDDLPGTEHEIKAIDEQMKANHIKTDVYLSNDATEGIMYGLSSPGILHIATHGYWAKIDYKVTSGYRMFNAMVNSGLLLAGVVNYYSQDELAMTHDGILTAYEAQNLDLEDTELVVLSACETGLGHFDAGEGVYGLQRAFRAAGAKSVITSLWKVDDEATKNFMIYFYTHYLESNNKITAFRKAQLELKNQYKDPYYWGAFVMIGE